MKNWTVFLLVSYVSIIFFWGSSFPAIRFALHSYTPESLALFRLLIASSFLVIIAIVLRIGLPNMRDVPMLVLLGCLGFSAYHLFLNKGETTVGGGIASLLVSTTPIFSLILERLYLKRKMGFSKWLGSFISFLGIAFFSLSYHSQSYSISGTVFILLASFSESLYFVFQTRYLKQYGMFAFITYTIWGGTIGMLWFFPRLLTEIEVASFSSTLAVTYLGVFSSVLPYLALAYINLKVGASEATTSLYLIPIVAVILSGICLDEKITLLSVGGGIITFLGLFLIHGKQQMSQAKDNMNF
ncbi:DMT family transporter [Priestia endophytica]|uniref:DMT family transporter n=1 Tax=Priestia endophytica TaxID=135735 RepID=UPI002280199B|nr:DMT family transporter [Priestia endophytica]MCY8233382.1 DMT family transporter [Priestia endophytica]